MKRNRQLGKCYKYKFNDIELWNLNAVLAHIIYDGLRQFKNSDLHGYPSDLGSFEEWEIALDKMIWSFEQIKNDYVESPYNKGFDKWFDENCNKVDNILEEPVNISEDIKKADKEYFNNITEGLILFSKYMQDLWD